MRQKTSIREKLGWISFCTIFITIVAGAIWWSIAEGVEENRRKEAIRTNTQETLTKISEVLEHIQEAKRNRNKAQQSSGLNEPQTITLMDIDGVTWLLCEPLGCIFRVEDPYTIKNEDKPTR